MIDRESRRVLELAREARTPTDADKVAVERRLAAALGATTMAVTATATADGAVKAGANTAAFGALKGWLAGGAVIAAAATGYVALSPAPRADAPSTERARTQGTRVQSPPPPTAAEPRPAAEPVPTAEPGTAVPAAPVPARSEHASARHVRARRSASQPSTLASELDLLHRAQAAWRDGQAASALALLAEHTTRFPRSTLAVERDALRALCLCDVGRSAEAAQLARSVLARAPHSPLRGALEQSCALR